MKWRNFGCYSNISYRLFLTSSLYKYNSDHITSRKCHGRQAAILSNNAEAKLPITDLTKIINRLGVIWVIIDFKFHGKAVHFAVRITAAKSRDR